MTFTEWLNHYAVGRLLGTHFGTAMGALWWTGTLTDAGGAVWKEGYAEGRR